MTALSIHCPPARWEPDHQHFDLELHRDRAVQKELMELLLLPRHDHRFTTCVLIHGMGGTGKAGEWAPSAFVLSDRIISHSAATIISYGSGRFAGDVDSRAIL